LTTKWKEKTVAVPLKFWKEIKKDTETPMDHMGTDLVMITTRTQHKKAWPLKGESTPKIQREKS